MPVLVPNWLVIQSSPQPGTCSIRCQSITSCTIPVALMSCTRKAYRVETDEGADRTFTIRDGGQVDYTDAAELTFTIWDSVNTAEVAMLEKTLTGGDIVLTGPTTAVFSISDTESSLLTAGSWYYEIWATLSTGERYLIGSGPFAVNNTRKYD